MGATTFDALAYFEKLKDAGFTEAQAMLQANTLQEVLDKRVVTREHLDSRVRETEAKIRESELRLQKEIEQLKYALLKWQIGIALVIVGIMAKGFGWLGF